MFTAANVKELRERTGCGMMDCKKALVETDGDMDKAIEFLREKGLAAAAKKAGRIASEGLVYCYTTDDNKVGVMIEVNSETDFVAKNADFQEFVKNLAVQVAKNNPADVDALLEEKYIGSDAMTVKEALTEKISTIGENMNIRRFERMEGAVMTYTHGEGRIGVLVKCELGDEAKAATGEFRDFAKNVAMQIASYSAQYVSEDDVPAEIVEKEKEILTAQALNEGKPEKVVEKMVAGRISKFFAEICLLDQQYIKDDEIKVRKYVENTAKELGCDVKVSAFARFEKGEGLEKKEDNFAEEIASLVK